MLNTPSDLQAPKLNSAEETRDISNQALSAKQDVLMICITKKINNASANGEYSVTVDSERNLFLKEEDLKNIKNLGYNIEYKDSLWNNYYKISWEK